MLTPSRTCVLATAVVAAALLAACGSDGESTTDTSATTDTAATTEVATTDPPATDPPATDPAPADPPVTDPPATDPPATAPPLPPTPIVGVLDQSYNFDGTEPDPDGLPAPVGAVEAHWYRAVDVLAVVYVGLDPAVDACPGNSAQNAEGFFAVSNAPLPNGSCPDFPTLIANTDTQGVQPCDARVGYLTLIPADSVVNLFASVERPDPDVAGVGITGFVQLPDPFVLPEIDPSDLSC